ncbi:flagellar hook-associated protein FlgL [Thermodesulfatator autotrophicus]|uniref:Flagellar hook-associated protein 3 n=1 Tax=Thermodesulfatator autotrophicus TaxID=1795632 RepID=A0A177E9E6_9BACT|nr:flagellar hook-associated protein FlgL [Thermodesulfatator autotrophicus]OAG28584.1 hypothetical protein TH606_01100 [Thermodesulfatator autotrophicus]
MPIRIGLKTQYDRMLNHLNRLTTELSDLQAQAASGIKFDKPSDAPVALVNTLNYRKAIEEIDRYQSSITESRGYLEAIDKAFDGLENIVTRAKELAIQGANDTLNDQDRLALAREVWNLLEEAVAVANSRHNGRYIFAGNRPTGYENGPFSLVKEALPGGEELVKVVYEGGREDLFQGYGPGQEILVGRNGEEAVSKSEIFESLIGLYKTLSNNNQVDPKKENENIQLQLERLDRVLNKLTDQHADVGARLDHLELKENLYADLKVSIQENISRTQDVDLLEVATQIRAKEVAYQSALAATAKVMQLSLVNYLS